MLKGQKKNDKTFLKWGLPNFLCKQHGTSGHHHHHPWFLKNEGQPLWLLVF